ncbi:MAG: hypothetical protein LBG75_03735 [Candidatus Nomurabacteria bacterium]|nr:hypothetical protein [Candidatus Nomurabacteria bacterium]
MSKEKEQPDIKQDDVYEQAYGRAGQILADGRYVDVSLDEADALRAKLQNEITETFPASPEHPAGEFGGLGKVTMAAAQAAAWDVFEKFDNERLGIRPGEDAGLPSPETVPDGPLSDAEKQEACEEFDNEAWCLATDRKYVPGCLLPFLREPKTRYQLASRNSVVVFYGERHSTDQDMRRLDEDSLRAFRLAGRPEGSLSEDEVLTLADYKAHLEKLEDKYAANDALIKRGLYVLGKRELSGYVPTEYVNNGGIERGLFVQSVIMFDDREAKLRERATENEQVSIDKFLENAADYITTCWKIKILDETHDRDVSDWQGEVSNLDRRRRSLHNSTIASLGKINGLAKEYDLRPFTFYDPINATDETGAKGVLLDRGSVDRRSVAYYARDLLRLRGSKIAQGTELDP